MFVPANPGYNSLHVIVHTVNSDLYGDLYGVGLLIKPHVGPPYLSPITVEGLPLTRALSRFAIECHHWTNRLNEKD